MSDLLQQPVFDVFIYALITAVATGFGALPFFFFKNLTRNWLGISNAIASGLMIAASFGLIYEGINHDPWFTFYGIIIGLLFIIGSEKLLNKYDDRFSIKNIDQVDSTKMLLIVGIMTVHSFTEGVSVGVSFSGGLDLGLFITTAIAVHNIPEGLAISLVLIPRGTSPLKAAWWSIFSSLPQPLMAVPAFLFVEIFRTYLPMGLGFAAGAMIWMVFAELVPDAMEESDTSTVATTITISIALMIIFQVLIE
ncbi:ZIP family metal transporter [Aliifodinibius salipaludis]|uniref:ZIP family metal transporter n=1 Tax=Fodinibius salipaludis TaxID=2032627 RepID=A0A2A2G9Y9_9BACT|nr:ZIP family metal transporter [Aliifodinibius salipaludis]PAU93655.1 ZIP family metal transporter [Aliifodinibius salipaludis]